MYNNFNKKLQTLGIILEKENITTLQVNVGKKCNLKCAHCHVGAGPNKIKENMTFDTAKAVVKLMDFIHISTIDLTGGAPELNQNFRFLVNEAKKRNIKIIDRCNLCVIFEQGLEYLPEFLAKNGIEIIASLPCYTSTNVDKQRGNGVFKKSIEALTLFNDLGYGKDETGLLINLVYNPVGPYLPPPQKQLEEEFKKRLFNDYGIVFNSLYTITNLPISRFGKYLEKTNKYDEYTSLLKDSFNPNVIPDLMCRHTLSVSWDGRLFDCDFNQIAGLKTYDDEPLTIFNYSLKKFTNLKIRTADHCFGCTAGAGSSCGGELGGA